MRICSLRWAFREALLGGKAGRKGAWRDCWGSGEVRGPGMGLEALVGLDSVLCMTWGTPRAGFLFEEGPSGSL